MSPAACALQPPTLGMLLRTVAVRPTRKISARAVDLAFISPDNERRQMWQSGAGKASLMNPESLAGLRSRSVPYQRQIAQPGPAPLSTWGFSFGSDRTPRVRPAPEWEARKRTPNSSYSCGCSQPGATPMRLTAWFDSGSPGWVNSSKSRHCKKWNRSILYPNGVGGGFAVEPRWES
jgi:hypothetical protein